MSDQVTPQPVAVEESTAKIASSLSPSLFPPEGSIERVYLDHALAMRRVAVRKFEIPEEDAETLVHDVFITFLVNPPVVHSNLRAYLIAAICNASRNYWRSKRTRDTYVAEGDSGQQWVTTGIPEESFFDGLSLHFAIAATLARLDPRCREALRRYYLDDENSDDIACALKTSSTNVNYLMHKCRKRARSIYEELMQIR